MFCHSVRPRSWSWQEDLAPGLPCAENSGGYHKAPYMIGAVFVGSAAFLAAGAVPHSMLPVSLLPC